MAIDSLKLFFALSIFAVIIAAGWYPFKNRYKKGHLDFPIGETLATGVFLGAAILHLLPEADKMLQHMGYQYPFAFVITGLTFLLFLWFEHLGKELYQQKNTNHPAFAMPLVSSRDCSGF